jgi:hypothetical protein
MPTFNIFTPTRYVHGFFGVRTLEIALTFDNMVSTLIDGKDIAMNTCTGVKRKDEVQFYKVHKRDYSSYLAKDIVKQFCNQFQTEN